MIGTLYPCLVYFEAWSQMMVNLCIISSSHQFSAESFQ